MPRRSHWFALLLIVFALPLTLAACGGDDDDGGGGSDEDAVVETIETATATNDPEYCSTLLAQSFLDQIGETVEDCEADAADDSDDADSVEVSNVAVDGESATAEATFTGGDVDGSTIAMSLVKEDDQWKIASFDEVLEFNSEGLRTALNESFASEDLTPEQIACIQGEVDAAADEDLEPILLGDTTALEEIVSVC